MMRIQRIGVVTLWGLASAALTGVPEPHEDGSAEHYEGLEMNDDPVIVQDVPRPISVTLLCTGDTLSFAHDHQQLELIVPDVLKAGHVTDVVRVEFGEDFDPTPYCFQHW